jgi:hypothetical protein
MTYDKLEKQHGTASSIADEDYLSLPEVGDGEKGWEGTYGRTGLSRRADAWVKIASRYGWLTHLALVLVNISLSFLLLCEFRQENSSSTMQVGSDFTGTGPDCKFYLQPYPGYELTSHKVRTKIVKFDADESFVPKNTSEFFSPDVTARWNTMMPGIINCHLVLNTR